MRSPEALVEAFREAGLKVTAQRQVIFGLLHENSIHPTAEAIHDEAQKRVPGISLRTVYQTLNDLTAMGEIQTLEFGTGSARFDPNVSDHHHAVCDACGAVRDVHVSSLPTMKNAGDFVVLDTHVVFRGLCNSCSK
jgi:Fe2+ or Zn2+ uptake regulation protein